MGRIDKIQTPTMPSPLADMLSANDINIDISSSIEPFHKSTGGNGGNTDNMLIEQGSRDDEIFHLAWTLQKGGMPESEIYKYLMIFAKGCVPPFPEKEALGKIKSALKRDESKSRGITAEIREMIESQQHGSISSADVQRCLRSSTRAENKKISVVLGRMVKEGLLKRAGKKFGSFEIINNSAPVIDLLSVKRTKLDIQFPLKIHTLYKCKPKNIIVVAGEQDAGKTAFCLSFAEMNMNRGTPIRYMSSEFGADGEELYERVLMFERPIGDWTGVEFIERDYDFDDLILPDGINVIDFMEVTSEFWNVGEQINKIHSALKRGIALISIQKSPHKEMGRGADFGREKPRLYLTLSSNPPEGGVAKILKAKNWTNPKYNPNLLECDFKLVGGCKFWGSEWLRPIKEGK